MVMRKREGFEEQVLHVIPRTMLREMAHHVLLYQLIATDIGWFPAARGHHCDRPGGTSEDILILCVAGSGWCEVGGARLEVRPSQAVMIPRGTPHSYGADPASPWSIHWVHLLGPAADYFFHLLPPGVFVMDVAPETADILSGLFAECYDAFVGSFAWQRMAYVTQTLQYLLGHLFFNNAAFSPLLRGPRGRSIDRTLDYMSSHLGESLTLQDLADHAHMSRSHFSRLFREQTGFSPIDYLIALRVQHAAMLLRFSDRTIREIGEIVGYDDPYYFSRIFKEVAGLSPTEFRSLAG